MHDDGSPAARPSVDRTRPLGVLAGFDGSDQSQRALLYAARAAQRLDVRLTVVTAFTVPALAYSDASQIPTVPAEVARLSAAQDVLDAANSLLDGYPGEVDLRTEHGDAAGVLVRLSEQAVLAVVGARGRGGFFGRLLGSVSSALPAHAHCPTVVVPRGYEVDAGEGASRFTPIDADTPVVMGTDRSPRTRPALDVAVQAALARQAPLHLVLAMTLPDAWGGSYMAWLPDPDILERQRTQLAAELEEDAAALRQAHPDLTVTSEAVLAEPVGTLIEHSRTAQLVVLGTRGHGRVASTLLGSVSQAVLQRAEGPVMVVPDDLEERAEASAG